MTLHPAHSVDSSPVPVTVRRVDYRDPVDAAALVALLDLYARDPMGGGTPLDDDVKARLCSGLAERGEAGQHLGAVSFIAWLPSALPNAAPQAVGLINCFEAYSTFKAQALMNIHDIAVHPAHRGRGVGQALLAAAADHARARGCCKLTLEVLSGNAVALASYQRFGFAGYQLDPAAGQAVFLQKWL